MHDEPMFRAKQVEELTGATYRQIDYWSRAGSILAAREAEGSGRPPRLYTLDQVVAVRAAAVLAAHGAPQHVLAAIVDGVIVGDVVDGLVVVCRDGQLVVPHTLADLAEGWLVDLGGCRAYVAERLTGHPSMSAA